MCMDDCILPPAVNAASAPSSERGGLSAPLFGKLKRLTRLRDHFLAVRVAQRGELLAPPSTRAGWKGPHPIDGGVGAAVAVLLWRRHHINRQREGASAADQQIGFRRHRASASKLCVTLRGAAWQRSERRSVAMTAPVPRGRRRRKRANTCLIPSSLPIVVAVKEWH